MKLLYAQGVAAPSLYEIRKQTSICLEIHKPFESLFHTVYILLFIEICYTATFVVILNFILLIMGGAGILLHEVKAHYVPILSSPEAARAVTETTSAASTTPARVV